MKTNDREPILEMDDVHVEYELDEGTVRAVRGASYYVYPGETLALVGESGCGKSQSSFAAMGLIQPPGRVSKGRILFRERAGAEPVDLLQFHRNSRELRYIRGGRMAMIFQEPMTALSPVHRIGRQLDEVLQLHTHLNRTDRFERACEMLTRVGIPDAPRRYFQYSFEFSGGMRQRIMAAMALCGEPRLLFADEPTTGLDVTIQAQILDLMKEIQRGGDMGIVLITHNLAVVAETADRVAVMYLGEIVELADVQTLFSDPKHPYTIALMGSVVGSSFVRDHRLKVIRGSVPGPLEEVPGCAFHPRCDRFMRGVCDCRRPEMRDLDGKTQVRCWLYARDL